MLKTIIFSHCIYQDTLICKLDLAISKINTTTPALRSVQISMQDWYLPLSSHFIFKLRCETSGKPFHGWLAHRRDLIFTDLVNFQNCIKWFGYFCIDVEPSVQVIYDIVQWSKKTLCSEAQLLQCHQLSVFESSHHGICTLFCVPC